MQAIVKVEIGVEGRFCWRCAYAPSFSYCELFHTRLHRDKTHETAPGAFKRCEACLATDNKSGGYLLPASVKGTALEKAIRDSADKENSSVEFY